MLRRGTTRYVPEAHFQGLFSSGVELSFVTIAATNVPPDVHEVLRSAGVRGAFEQLAPSHKRQFLEWIAEAKKPETRRRRIGKTVESLRRKG